MEEDNRPEVVKIIDKLENHMRDVIKTIKHTYYKELALNDLSRCVLNAYVGVSKDESNRQELDQIQKSFLEYCENLNEC